MEPSREQLKAVIASGDDRKMNALVLKTTGEFKLLDITGQTPAQLSLPDCVGRFETFGQFNGYVGVEASKDHTFINNTFNDMMELWEIYKKTGKTDMHSIA